MRKELSSAESYRRKTKELLLQSRFASHPKRKKQALKAQRKIKTIANVLVRELERKLNCESLQKHRDDGSGCLQFQEMDEQNPQDFLWLNYFLLLEVTEQQITQLQVSC